MKSETSKAAAAFLAELLKEPGLLDLLSPIFSRIGEQIAAQTAAKINERHASSLVPPKDALIPVSDCCAHLGVSLPTFKKHFVATKKLALYPPPPGADRRQRYVSAKAFANLIKEAPMKVVSIKKAA